MHHGRTASFRNVAKGWMGGWLAWKGRPPHVHNYQANAKEGGTIPSNPITWQEVNAENPCDPNTYEHSFLI